MTSQVRKFIEDDCVIKFLKGLGDDYEAVKSQVLLTSPLPDLKTVFAMAVKVERKLTYANNQTHFSNNPSCVLNVGSTPRYDNSVGRPSSSYGNNTGTASNWKNVNRGYKGNNQKSGFSKSKTPICTYCQMLGHTVDRCYKKHGYPPGYKPRSNVNHVFSYSVGLVQDSLQGRAIRR